jgi:gamma-glutamyl:cysteine ligase YbdK (ATP-grasp superfamily)
VCKVDDFSKTRMMQLLTPSRLIKHTVETIRTRLDRIYLDALKSSSASNGRDSNNQEVNNLQEELESLYSEIFPVAQMSAEQQFLEPALRTIAATNGQGQERSVKAVKYVSLHCLHSRY